MKKLTGLSAALFVTVICTSHTLVAQQTPGTASQGAAPAPTIAAVDSELAQTHYRRGNTYNNLERYEEAVTEYQLSITADPYFADSVRNLANIYYFQKRYEEAIPMLARFVELQREKTAGLIAALNTLGELLRNAQRYDEAIAVDLRAIETDPQNLSQMYVMGNTYHNAGRTEDAIRIYEKAVSVQNQDAFIHRTLGRMYEDEGRLEEALIQYQAAAGLDTGSQFYKDLISALEARLAARASGN